MEVIDASQRDVGRSDEQVTHLDPRRGGGAVVAHRAHQEALAVRQAHRRAQLPGDIAGGEAHAEHEPASRLAAHQGVDALAQRAIGRQREVEAVRQAGGVEADDEAMLIDEW